jgi:uncharacterized OB-fold protein
MGSPQPVISTGPDAGPFWEAAKRHRLALPYCTRCDEPFFYPRTHCPACGSRLLEWREVSGRGVLYAFCIQPKPAPSAVLQQAPLVPAIVQLEEGPRLMSCLVGVDPTPEAITCDMPVIAEFIDLPDGQTLPVFAPGAS